MNKGQRWMIGGALLAVLILVAGWFLVVSPVRSKTTDTKATTADLNAQNATLQAQLNQLIAQNKSVTAKQAALSNIGAEVPSDPHLPQLIRTLSSSASDSGVDLVSLTPSAPTTSNPGAAVSLSATAGTVSPTSAAAATYQTIPVNLSVDGDYSGLEEFIQHLETIKRIFVVNSVSLTPVGVAGATGLTAAVTPGGMTQTVHTLTLTISGSVFMTDPGTTAISLPALNGTTSAPTSSNS